MGFPSIAAPGMWGTWGATGRHSITASRVARAWSRQVGSEGAQLVNAQAGIDPNFRLGGDLQHQAQAGI